MRKKNLSVKVAALAMSGTLAMAPMTVRAAEVAAPTATEGAETTANGTTESGTGATTAPVTVEESAVDPSTTVPNNVNTVIPEENNNFQGTKIDVGSYVNKEITAKDAKGTKGDTNFNPGFFGRIGTNLGSVKNKNLDITGDLSIKESSAPDT